MFGKDDMRKTIKYEIAEGYIRKLKRLDKQKKI